ncbi:hypothetical protein [Methyloceanibacter sp.]|uniref:hypothetical protein n=1 Tax=Methyloceanibacter sp. TaxID=1965321 RepID=UPI002D2D834E|nr:hypothetical protein [Methyloceanibacter sp.]HZP09034.1 hypothetical protein [Methyloceanibacter sp.]
MKHLRLVIVLGGAACLAVASGSAYAFDIEGQNASLDDGSPAHFATPVDDFIKSNGGARSLAMPLTGEADSSMHISDYGNSIAIPAPGAEAPAWSYSSPLFQRKGY